MVLTTTFFALRISTLSATALTGLFNGFKFKTIFVVIFMPDYDLNIKPIWYVFCDTKNDVPLLVSPINSELELYDISKKDNELN